MAKPESKVVKVRVVGPLEPQAHRFESFLIERGYTPLTRVNHLQVMGHLSRWLDAQEVGLGGLTPAVVDEYLAGRRSDGYGAFCTRASLAPLLQVLAAAGALLAERASEPAGPVQVLLDDYARFLRQERGLADSTTAAYVLRARRFLDGHGYGADLGAVDAAVVTKAVLAEADRVSAGSAQFFVVALRSFLRYCHLAGLIATDLSGASLPVTGRRRSVLPQGISPAQGRALLGSCDRRTAQGRRDYAVIVLMLRMGLRASEVAALCLEDIDWRAGQITVRGKHRRLDQLPLPEDVGGAIAGYLRHGRPTGTAGREVFVRTIAPAGRLTREAVGLIVRRASTRAGLEAFGSHRLRHTAACDMLRAGTPLAQIGQVLRQADATSTSIYARVDVERLRTIARPTPAGSLR